MSSVKDQKENAQGQLDSLRDAYIAYKETLNRCKIEMKPRAFPKQGKLGQGTQKKQETEYKNFYLPPRTPHLDEPERQKKFRREYIAEVGARPEPEPIRLLADALHLEVLSITADHSRPSVARGDLAGFFRRHAVSLQHKKYRMLGRWGNQATRSQQVDTNAIMFDRTVARLQKEFDAAFQRSQRLQYDDAYDDAVNPDIPRPQPTSRDEDGGRDGALLYVEAPDRIINSAIRHDDIEVYLRVQTYRAKLFRSPEKLATSIKWLPASRRFDIWTASRVRISEFKERYNEDRNRVLLPVTETVKQRLIGAGVADEKLLHLVAEKYTKHLKQEAFPSRNEAALNCHKMNHEKPPFLYTSNVEMKVYLVPLAHQYQLSVGDFLEIDDGHNFSYQVQGLFAPKFQQQVLQMQFDLIDSGEITQEDTDVLLIQKLTAELGLDKNEMLAEMAKQSEIERGKSILGKLGKENPQAESALAKNSKQGSGKDAQNDIARVNLIRRIKEMKFFSLDETDYHLKKADWLRFVCWQPTVGDEVKRQNNLLSSGDENPIDSLLLSAFELVDVNEAGAANKILEDAATAHIRKVRSYFSDLSQRTVREAFVSRDAAENGILNQAVKAVIRSHQEYGSKPEEPKSEDQQSYNQAKVENFLQNVDPLKQNLVKSYYTLRLLKTRETKCKLVQCLNYFRGVQRRLAFDVREFYTRERALGGQKIDEALISPQFGRDEDGNLKSKNCGSQGPGGVNANRLTRHLDNGLNFVHGEDGDKRADPISLKGFKFNKCFNPAFSSTCPCLPKFHTTFGRPTLYEEVSQELERKGMENTPWRSDATPIASYKDKLVFHPGQGDAHDCEIAVIDQHGIRIVYEESLNDVVQLEEEMLKVGSHFLNKAEILQHTNPDESPSTMLDRGEVTLHLMESELKLQLLKIELVEILLEVYEHTCDPLESVRILQMIADNMAQRPRINLDAAYFLDSYTSEMEAMRSKVELYREVVEFQKITELAENDEIRRFQELKMRKLMDFVDGKWTYQPEKTLTARMGTKEEYAISQGQEVSKQNKRAKHMQELQKQLALKDITERHITEFAGDQQTDFANVLGLPEVTAGDLFKKQGQMDPLIIDAIREHSHFSKQIEGYPWFHQRLNVDEDLSAGLHTKAAGLTDFFDSLCCITRINAACEQAYSELSTVHHPENGVAASALESCMLLEARGCFKVLRSELSDGSYSSSEAQGYLEEDFFLASSDKLVYLMRELTAGFHPERIAQVANPLHVAKLAVSEVAKFDFPRLKPTDVAGFGEISDEKVAENMIGLAKASISRKYGEDQPPPALVGGAVDENEDKPPEIIVRAPSMLELGCNLVEVVRLRQDLIQIVYETTVLSSIYKEQLAKANKSTWKLIGHDPIPFETQAISKDNMNFVDKNDGSKLELGLAALEFDASIGANFDFKSESCVKALMMSLGVEELRAVVHYQLMQKQLLAIAVLRNQAVTDGTLQGLEELELLKRKPALTVPGAAIRLVDVLSKAVDGVHVEQSKAEQARLASSLSKDAGEHIFSIAARKQRHRPVVSKKYSALLQRVNGQTLNMEAKLRVLRAYRLSLMHEFCQNVLREAYQDSLTIHTLLACGELRRKTGLFPRGTRLFTARIGGLQEHCPQTLTDRKEVFVRGLLVKDGVKAASLEDFFKGTPQTLFYIPSTTELLETLRTKQNEAPFQGGIPATALTAPESVDLHKVDSIIYKIVKPPTKRSLTERLESKSARPLSFNEAFDYSGLSWDLLSFFTNMLQAVSVEYLMGRNDAPGVQVLNLESKVLSGEVFWKPEGFYHEDDERLQENLKSIPERVVAKIMNAKRAQVDLAEDIGQIANRLRAISDDFVRKETNAEHKKLPFLKELMRLQHLSSFTQFLNGLEQVHDIYLDHKSGDNFAKIQAEIFTLSRRDHGFNLLGNGIYFAQGTRRGCDVCPASPVLRDQEQFERSFTPMVDDLALVPAHQTLVRKLYGQNSLYEGSLSPSTTWTRVPDYKSMYSSFLNMDDEQRSFISSNFQQLEDGVNDYLILLGLISDPNRKSVDPAKEKILILRPKDIMQARCEYLGLKVEARHLQRVLMSWVTCKALPDQIPEYLKAQQLFRDQTMLKTLMERDSLIEHYYAHKEGNKREGDTSTRASANKVKKEKTAVLESVNFMTREHGIVSSLNQTKAEITVARRVLEGEMVKISLNAIQNEHASMLAAFEQGAAENKVHSFVHPQQQYASTLYQSVDNNSHLNVVNKLDFVQQFLTKLRNRCTEVETLASGPGIVFSIKDFNECLQSFCAGLLKYCEVELRSRVETSHIRQNQFQHLLYMKEKQALYYRRKCDQFLGDIDKLVNAKITQKGGQLLYELDVASRELRVLRENYRLMQKMMTQELRHEYMRAIQERDDKIGRLAEAYTEEKSRVSKTTIVEVETDFKVLVEKIEKKGQQALNTDSLMPRQTLPAGLRGSTKPYQLSSGAFHQTQKQPQVTAFETDALREVLSLQTYIRKYRAFVMMKQVFTNERHEKELANQRAQLTSNAALWDQLAEAEKREQITKQELNLTKLSLASYEKLIEKLQGQLENLNSQKARLQQYKNSKSKRIDELENKMKDLEILENIDLNRILTELKSRDKKIGYLEAETKAQKDELHFVVQEQNQREVHKLQKALGQEREMKHQAYDRLDGLRVELRALEGQDMKSDLWKDKCKELFDICKELERENDHLKGLVNEANNAHLFQAAQEIEASKDLFEQASNLNRDIKHGSTSKSMGHVSVAGRSTLNSRAGDRFLSNRTLGANGRYIRREIPHATTSPPFAHNEVSLKNPSMPSVYHSGAGLDGETGEGIVHSGLNTRKGQGDMDPVASTNYNATNNETLHSQPVRSRQASGHPGYLHFAEGQEILSLGSKGLLIGQTLNPPALGVGGSVAGGVLAGPLPNFAQPRNIMTAGGHARTNKAGKAFRAVEDELGTRPRQGPPLAGPKRLQTSVGPRGVGMVASLSRGAGPLGSGKIGSVRDSNARASTNPYFHPHNQPQGLNMLGKSFGTHGPRNGAKNDQLLKGSLHGQTAGPQQAVNFNINFNTTNINVAK